jgi:hypothetical protein
VKLRDREVLELLRDEPELLAIADAVTETEHRARSLPAVRWIGTVALAAAALFVLVLASPWDRGGGGTVLGRALGAIDTTGSVVHLTTRLDSPGAESLTAESFYEPRTNELRVVTRDEGQVVSDFTTRAYEDQFTTFPGLLDAVAFYRTALENGQAKVVGKGAWHGRPVYWVELERGGGFQLRIGLDRDTYRPIVFRGVNPDGTPAGFQLAVLSLGYVSPADAAFETDAPVLVQGRVFGGDCRPVRARVDAFLSGNTYSKAAVTSGRAGADGRFTLRLDPATLPLAGRGPFAFRLNVQGSNGFMFRPFSRVVRDGRWAQAAPLRVDLGDGC